MGEATRGKGHKNQKAQQQQSNVSCLKHTELECLCTNAYSFINKFSEFKEIIKLCDFKKSHKLNYLWQIMTCFITLIKMELEALYMYVHKLLHAATFLSLKST